MEKVEKKKQRTIQWELIKLRDATGVTREEMAKIVGVSTYTYNYKERGERPFTADEIYRICEFFEVGFDDIFLPSNSN